MLYIFVLSRVFVINECTERPAQLMNNDSCAWHGASYISVR